MSTTAEMSQCCEILMEADSPSSSSPSPTKDETCSGSQCGTPPDEAEKSNKKTNKTEIFEESDNLVNIESSRRASAVFETHKSRVEYPRRHSVQVLRSEESFRHRNRRPSSTQDMEATQQFYTSLTGFRYN